VKSWYSSLSKSLGIPNVKHQYFFPQQKTRPCDLLAFHLGGDAMNSTGVVEERGMRVRFRGGGSPCHGGQHAPHERSPMEEATDRTNRAMTTLVGTAWNGCNPIAMIGTFGRGRLVPAIAVIPPPSACGVVAAKLSSSPRTPPPPLPFNPEPSSRGGPWARPQGQAPGLGGPRARRQVPAGAGRGGREGGQEGDQPPFLP